MVRITRQRKELLREIGPEEFEAALGVMDAADGDARTTLLKIFPMSSLYHGWWTRTSDSTSAREPMAISYLPSINFGKSFSRSSISMLCLVKRGPTGGISPVS
jgi:hypothetical protein